MKRPIATAVLLMLGLPNLAAQVTDTATMDAGIGFFAPGPSCTLSRGSHLVFGSWVPGPGGIEYNAQSGLESRDLVQLASSTSLGSVTLEVRNSATYVISATAPNQLKTSGGAAVAFTRNWAYRNDNTEPWTTISADQHNSGSLSSNVTHYFQFGGNVGQITDTTPFGTYGADIEVNVSCS